jgi:hypothetical protein
MNTNNKLNGSPTSTHPTPSSDQARFQQEVDQVQRSMDEASIGPPELPLHWGLESQLEDVHTGMVELVRAKAERPMSRKMESEDVGRMEKPQAKDQNSAQD